MAVVSLLTLRASTTRPDAAESILQSHVLVTYYGNPRSAAMGVLGRLGGDARAEALRQQAAAYARLSTKRVLSAYHLVAVVAQPSAGTDGMFRRRESPDVIRDLLIEARRHGFHLVLDVQSGRSPIDAELACLRPFLQEPDVHLALDPEFDMEHGRIPGRTIGFTPAAEVNAAAEFLNALVVARGLPPKVLIVHQFTIGMLPDVQDIRSVPRVDLVLDMDGFGSRALKLNTYRTIMRRWPASRFAGFKLFYTMDTDLLAPEDVMRLTPTPSVIVYQ
jgi:hypothetical protein